MGRPLELVDPALAALHAVLSDPKADDARHEVTVHRTLGPDLPGDPLTIPRVGPIFASD